MINRPVQAVNDNFGCRANGRRYPSAPLDSPSLVACLIINYTYDIRNRPETVSESGGESYMLGMRHADHGGVDEIEYGNFLKEKYCFNDRLQMTGIELSPDDTPSGEVADCLQTASNLITLNFDYGSATQNNGNLVGQTIGASAAGIWQQYYTYDGTNRLAMASENAPITGSTCPAGATWCRKYGYDHFGNRWIASSLDTLHMATPTAQSAVSLATNRLTSGTYDAAGNLTAQTHITTGGGSIAYDANNKVKAFTAAGFTVYTAYDTAGRRVVKLQNGQTTVWVYDAFGKLAAEYTTETQTTPAGTYYRTTDHLGSTRLVTDDLGGVRQRRDFFPFGEQIPASTSFGNRQDVVDGGLATYNAGLSMRQQFTGQQRDEETGLDYFWARNMATPLGRFLSVDPEGAGASPSNPQSWNAFGYVPNNPLRLIDPDGRAECDVSNPIPGGSCEVFVYGTAPVYDPFFIRPAEGPHVHDPRIMICYLWPDDPACAELAEEIRQSTIRRADPSPKPDIALEPDAKEILGAVERQTSILRPCSLRLTVGYGYGMSIFGRRSTQKRGFSVDREGKVRVAASTSLRVVDQPWGSVSVGGGVRASSAGSYRGSREPGTIDGGVNTTLMITSPSSPFQIGGSVSTDLDGNVTPGMEARAGAGNSFFIFAQGQASWPVTSPCSQ